MILYDKSLRADTISIIYNHSVAFSDGTHRVQAECCFQDTDWGEVWTER